MASKGAPEGTEKATAEKTTQPKAMDIHPVGTAPTVAGGKPVMVGSKSRATDPMLSVNKPAESKEAKPIETAAGDATTAPVISRHVKTISPLTAAEAEGPLDQENDAVAKSVEAITTPKAKEENEKGEADIVDSDSQVDQEEPESSEKSAETTESGKAEPAPKEKTAETTPPEELAEQDVDDTATALAEEETVSQEKTAEQMREDQIDEFIQKKTYAVPIDKTGHRRHNAMLALLLVLVALVVTLNFLLDLGVITIPGAPSTDIFAQTSL